MKVGPQPRKWLAKKAKRGAGSYPVGTLAFYGPDNRRASKAAAGVIRAEDEEAPELRRWFAEAGDIRADDAAFAEVVDFFRERGVRSVTMVDGIIGCPHEEVVDYPEGEACPACPFWAGRDRWTGVLNDAPMSKAQILAELAAKLAREL